MVGDEARATGGNAFGLNIIGFDAKMFGQPAVDRRLQ